MKDKDKDLFSLSGIDIEELEGITAEVSKIDQVLKILGRLAYFLPEVFFLACLAYIFPGISDIATSSQGNPLDLLFEVISDNVDSLAVLFVTYLSLSIVRFLKEIINRFCQKIKARFEIRIDRLYDILIDFFEELFKAFWWNVLHRPTKQYHDFVAGEHDRFEPPGNIGSAIPCRLQDVCVGLNVRLSGSLTNDRHTDSNKSSISSEPIDLGSEAEIWNFLALGKHQDNLRHMVLRGKPGSGKSTLLKILAVAYAKGAHRRASNVSRKAPRLIPILISIREISHETFASDKSLASVVTQSLQRLEIAKSQRFVRWLENRLKNGKCLVMIDGLDEVANKENQKKANFWVARLIKKYHKSYFLITSRHFGHDTQILQDVTILEMLDLNLMHAEEFICNWHLNKERFSQLFKELQTEGNIFWRGFPRFIRRSVGYDAAVRKRADIAAGELISKIRSRTELAQMAMNPLSLSMMVIVHSNGDPLPESRAKLYRVICDSLLSSKGDDNPFEKANPTKKISLSKPQNMAVLQSLSLVLMKTSRLEFQSEDISELISEKILELTGSTDISAEDFLAYIKKNSGLLVDIGMGVSQFSHRCIQEYFAALQIRESREEDFLINQVNENWWNETIRIYAATSIIDSAIRIVNTAVQGFEEDPERNSVAFKLAYDCLEDCPTLPEGIKAKLYDLLNRSLESENFTIRTYAAEVKLLQRFSRNFIPFTNKTEFDRACLTRSEYQIFIDAMKPLGKYYQPEIWHDSNFPKSTSLKSVFVLRHTDAEAFCHWLSKRHAKEGFKFRLPTVQEEERSYRDKHFEIGKYGCWCTSNEDYSIVGVKPKQVNDVRRALRSKVRFDIHNSKVLQKRIYAIHSISLELRDAAARENSNELSISLRKLLAININSQEEKTIFLDDTLITFLLSSIAQMKDIFNSLKTFRRDANVKASVEMRRRLTALRKHLGSGKRLSMISEIKKAKSLIEEIITNHGRAKYRKQEIVDVYRVFFYLVLPGGNRPTIFRPSTPFLHKSI